jgi:hypothetical protein
MMKTRMKLATVLLLMMLVGGLQTTAAAQSTQARENRIVGLWDVQVNNLNCTTGVQVSSFRGMHKYELGGTAQIVPATNPAALSAHMGVWRHIEWNDYKLSVKTFRFDAAGNNIGWIIIKADVAINEDATGYAGSGQAEIFDANGTMVARSCPTFAGTRFVSE